MHLFTRQSSNVVNNLSVSGKCHIWNNKNLLDTNLWYNVFNYLKKILSLMCNNEMHKYILCVWFSSHFFMCELFISLNNSVFLNYLLGKSWLINKNVTPQTKRLLNPRQMIVTWRCAQNLTCTLNNTCISLQNSCIKDASVKQKQRVCLDRACQLQPQVSQI